VSQKLFVYRHPKKDGPTKDDLGPVGIAQAMAQGKRFTEHCVVDLLACSTLGRTALTMAAFMTQLNQEKRPLILPPHPALGNAELFKLMEQSEVCMGTFATGSGWFKAIHEGFEFGQVKSWAMNVHDVQMSTVSRLREYENNAVVFGHGGMIELGVWAALDFPTDQDGKACIPNQFDKVAEMAGVEFRFNGRELVPVRPIDAPHDLLVQSFRE